MTTRIAVLVRVQFEDPKQKEGGCNSKRSLQLALLFPLLISISFESVSLNSLSQPIKTPLLPLIQNDKWSIMSVSLSSSTETFLVTDSPTSSISSRLFPLSSQDDGAPKKASTSKAFAPFKSPMGSKSKASLPSSDDRIKEMKQEIAALEMQLQ